MWAGGRLTVVKSAPPTPMMMIDIGNFPGNVHETDAKLARILEVTEMLVLLHLMNYRFERRLPSQSSDFAYDCH